MSAKSCPWCDRPGKIIDTKGNTTTYTCAHAPDGCDFDVEDDSWDVVGLAMESSTTGRGFRIFKFKDRYDEECTLQASSLATESAIWFGSSGRIQVGPPWREYALPDNAIVNSRMHLTQQQVADLLPTLQHFAEHGSLPEEALDA